ncbi:carboxymuconolactone decarboxylase family protein [Peribacillus frigoritolerans]|uniref:carboxymuconolactone decarboxylase family protein n=1 Tax=Peribacillus frigoritolerans TaxID=450367 RepID=UPI0022824B20|nr:carboxymuconolactone decarboxylase family protein [Peribacillus frigoritolerans]MCY8938237.1 carboxymuconolactone decarboxylase family protein [Peribacillus frigoritolerans]
MGNRLSNRQIQLKKNFTEINRNWHDVWDELLVLDEEFFEILSNFTVVPWKTGVLEPKIKELINVAISASPTHLSAPATRIHIQNALRFGATSEEILEVFKVVSILGMHTCAVGVPLMTEEFELEALFKDAHLTDQQKQLKTDFIEQMGYWNGFRDVLLQMDEKFFESYTDFLTAPLKSGVLEPKIIEFIYIAIDASTTHLFRKGIQVHLKNARKYGATSEEILEVFQLTSSLGFDTLLMGIPILIEEMNKRSR